MRLSIAKKAIDYCDVIVYGEPVNRIVTEEEYENGEMKDEKAQEEIKWKCI